MSDYRIVCHFDELGQRLEDVIIKYFTLYLDNDNYE